MEFDFNGACTIEQADTLRQSLLDLVKNSDHITLQFGKVEQVDITFFQLLESAIQTCHDTGKVLELKSDFPKKLAFDANVMGFSRIVEFSA